MKIVINSKYHHLRDFIERIPAELDTMGRTLYKARNEIKVVNVNGLNVNIKAYQIPHFINRFAYAYVRKSKAERTYFNAHKLQNLSVNTPEPIAYINCYKGKLLWKSYFISVHLDYSSTIRDIISFDSENKELLLRQFTRFTYFSLIENHVHHLDYSRGNILITHEKYLYKFSIVDINRMVFEKLSYKAGLRIFSKLWAEEEELEIIGDEYANITNESSEKTIALLKKMDQTHKAKIENKSKVKEYLRRLVK